MVEMNALESRHEMTSCKKQSLPGRFMGYARNEGLSLCRIHAPMRFTGYMLGANSGLASH